MAQNGQGLVPSSVMVEGENEVTLSRLVTRGRLVHIVAGKGPLTSRDPVLSTFQS